MDSLVAELKQAITLQNVVVVAGSGVALNACSDQVVDGHAVAGWEGLLLHGIERCAQLEHVLDADDAALLAQQVRTGKPRFLVSAAELVSRALQGKRAGVYKSWLSESIGRLKCADAELALNLAALGGVLATLNYDGLLEQATQRRPVTWRDADQVERVLRGETNDIVLHLHGHYEEPASIVLGHSSYDLITRDEHASSVLRCFALERTLLFVGCRGTVSDPNFSQLIDWATRALAQSTHRHFLLCRESEIEHVRTELASAPWLYPLPYGSRYSDLSPWLRSLRSGSGGRNRAISLGPKWSAGLDEYARTIRQRYGRLKLESMDLTGIYYREMELWKVFVPQRVLECDEFLPHILELPREHLNRLRDAGSITATDVAPVELEDVRRRYLDQAPSNSLELLDGHPSSPKRIVILGDPGSGKSSLLQAVAVRWAERTRETRTQFHLPIVVELRAYALARERSLARDFLEFVCDGHGVPSRLDREQVTHALQEGRAQVLFDALDEVFDAECRSEVVNSILQFANDYPAAQIVVTSRVIGYRGGAFRDAGFNHYILQDFDDEQIRAFIEAWHEQTHRALEANERDARQSQLSEAIARFEPVRELARNPLLLTMLSVLNRYRNLAQDRVNLYAECSRLLLQQWKVDEALRADPTLSADALAIGLDEKESILRRLARVMLAGGDVPLGNLIRADVLESTIEECLQSVIKNPGRSVARALVAQLRERNFILCFAGAESYAFVHRTFMEFYCAMDLQRRFEKEQTLSLEQLKFEIFGGHCLDEGWHELLCLLAGVLEPRFVGELVQHLLGLDDPEGSQRHVFLAARCIGEARNQSQLSLIAGDVCDALEAIAEVDGDLSALFDRALEVRARAEKARAIRLRAISLRSRTCASNPQTRAWLEQRASSGRDGTARFTAAQERIRGWRTDRQTLAWLKAIVLAETDVNVRYAAIQELARTWKTDSEVLPILKTRARDDTHAVIRYAAIRALAQGWPGDPQTQQILIARCMLDADSIVRYGVVREIIGTCDRTSAKQLGETLGTLRTCARKDDSSIVRYAAIQELAAGWEDDPATYELVLECAETDESSNVRCAAIQELARRWYYEPRTLAVIKDHVESDVNASVRRTAWDEIIKGWRSEPKMTGWIAQRRGLFTQHPAARGSRSSEGNQE